MAQTLMLDQEQLVQRVTLQIENLIEERLRQAIESFMQEQTAMLWPRLRHELAPLVRQSVEQAIATETGQP